MSYECARCGLAACDLPDGIDPELIFEHCECGLMLCQGCALLHDDTTDNDSDY
jgi:hypothetical protein